MSFSLLSKRRVGKLFVPTRIPLTTDPVPIAFKTLTSVDMRHIPYGAGGPYNDLVGGQVPLMFDTFSPFLPNAPSGPR